MKLWILDTDHLSLIQRNNPLALEHFNATKTEEIAVTVVTVEEQMRGRLSAIKRAASDYEIMEAYARLRANVEVLQTFKLLDFDRPACELYEQLRRQKIRIGTQDLRIAAIALSANGVLVTRNRRDFSKVPGLNLEDWTITESGFER